MSQRNKNSLPLTDKNIEPAAHHKKSPLPAAKNFQQIQEAGYKAMAADAEREQEAQE